ncbi:hypothetical protein GCM10027048_06410 [Hymenobacter coalescens]
MRPDRDTVLYGAQGTMLAVPAYAFQLAGSPDTTLAEPVELRVREFYQLPDILLQNLTTTADGALLETGGMLHLEARTAAGRACALRPEAELLVQMPPSERPPQPGMQLYSGTTAAPHRRLNWQRPRRPLSRNEFNGRGVVFPGGAGAFRQHLRRTIPYSWEMYQQLKHAPQSARQRQDLRTVGGGWLRPQLLAYALVFIDFDVTGATRAVRVSLTGDSAQVLAPVIQRAAEQLPRFRPAYLQGPIRRRLVGASSSRVLSTVPRKQRGPRPAIPRFPVVGSTEALISVRRNGRIIIQCSNQGYVGSSSGNGLLNIGTSRRWRQLAGVPDRSVSTDSLDGTLFATPNLGWLNFDRPLPAAQPAVLFTALAGDAAVRAYVVLRNTRTVLGSLPSTEGRHLFPGVPDAQPATLVAMKRENGRYYLATQPVTLGAKTESNLVFRPLQSATELRAALAQLEF